MNSWWTNGQCRRGHDITDPANIRIVRRRNGTSSRRCRPCEIAESRGRRHGTPVPRLRSEYPPHECATCGRAFTVDDRPWRRRMAPSNWARQRYCSTMCGRAGIAADRRIPPLRAGCETVLPPCATCGRPRVRQRTRDFRTWQAHGFAKQGCGDKCGSCYARSLRGETGPAQRRPVAATPDPEARCDCGELIIDHQPRTLSDTELARLRRMVGAA